jgi:hypothetical protein
MKTDRGRDSSHAGTAGKAVTLKLDTVFPFPRVADAAYTFFRVHV